MKRSFKNLVWRYVRFVGQRPSSWLIALTVAFFPNPMLPTPERIVVPVLRKSSVTLPEEVPYPIRSGAPPPMGSAKAVYVVDIDSMVPMYVKNPDEPLPPASITKIVTSLVAMDAFGKTQVLGAKDDGPVIGKTIKLTPREQFSFFDLLYGLLLESGNDVALALGENYPGGYQVMVDAMNQKAKEFGLRQSSFKNVSGIDEPGHVMSARDISIVAIKAMENPAFHSIAGMKEKTITTLDGSSNKRLQNTNELLGVVPGVLGVKTGQTPEAGECFVAYVEQEGRRIVTVVLGSNDRFLETKNLIEWVFQNHEWSVLLNSRPPITARQSLIPHFFSLSSTIQRQ